MEDKRVKASFEFHGSLIGIGGTVRVEVSGDTCSEAIENIANCISTIFQKTPLPRLALARRILNPIINRIETIVKRLRRLK
jgi:ABC-type lipoprotein release transport system permease subunit